MGGVKNNNLVRIGQKGGKGGGQAELFGEIVNGRSLTVNISHFASKYPPETTFLIFSNGGI